MNPQPSSGVPAHCSTPPASARTSAAPARRGRFLAQTYSGAAGTRSYKLYVPLGYEGQACPLIVMLHGCTQTPDDFAAGTRMNALADEFTALIAYPEQSASANASRCWNWFKNSDQQRDRGEPSIVAGITRRIMGEYAVDPGRVYVAGMSAGGAAAAVLAATYPELYAAIGVHSGLACGIAHDVRSAAAAMRGGVGDARPPVGCGDGPAVPPRIPTIVFHGDRDVTVHPSNGDRFLAGAQTAGCAQLVESGRVVGGRAFTRTAYTDPAGRPVFEQWLVHGVGHAWSGGSRNGSFTDPGGPDASREIVRFFLANRRI